MIDYYDYFRSSICLWACAHEHKSEVCKNEACLNASFENFIKCRLSNYELYKNVRYRDQINCLVSKYVRFMDGVPNEVFNSLKIRHLGIQHAVYSTILRSNFINS